MKDIDRDEVQLVHDTLEALLLGELPRVDISQLGVDVNAAWAQVRLCCWLLGDKNADKFGDWFETLQQQISGAGYEASIMPYPMERRAGKG